MITGAIGAVLVLVVLSGIVWLMVQGAPPTKDVEANLNLGILLEGALAVVALDSAVATAGVSWTGRAIVGAVVGLMYFPLLGTGQFQRVGSQVLSGLLGAVGLVTTAGTFLLNGTTDCGVSPLWQRAVTIVIIALTMVGGSTAAWWRGIFRFPSLLAAFGALKITIFIASPLSVSFLGLSWPASTLSLIAAAAFGFAAGVWPRLVIGVGAVFVAVVAFGASVVFGSACNTGPQLQDLVPVAGYAGVYWILRALLGRFLGGVSTSRSS